MNGLLSILKPSSCPKTKNRGVFNLFFGANARDGSSAAKAIVVDSVAEEYAWLASNCKDFTIELAAVSDDKPGKPYDVITLHDASGGERKVYFDISKFYTTNGLFGVAEHMCEHASQNSQKPNG